MKLFLLILAIIFGAISMAALAGAIVNVGFTLAYGKEPAPTVGLASLSAAAALLATTLSAAYQFDLFRNAKPHLTLTQDVQSQGLGESYRLVVVTTTLINSSRVLVKPTDAWCRLAMTGPLADGDVEEIYNSARREPAGTEFDQYGWWELDMAAKQWQDGDFAVEPNERVSLPFQFIISASVTAISVVTAVLNPEEPRSGDDGTAPKAWLCYTLAQLPLISGESETEAL